MLGAVHVKRLNELERNEDETNSTFNIASSCIRIVPRGTPLNLPHLPYLPDHSRRREDAGAGVMMRGGGGGLLAWKGEKATGFCIFMSKEPSSKC